MSALSEDTPSALGGTVGGRIARLVSDASALSRAKTSPAVAKAVNTIIADWFRIMDREARQAMDPLLRSITDSPDLPPEAKQLLLAISRPTGQWQAFTAQSVAGNAASIGLGALLNNLMAGPIQEQLARLPNSLLDPATAAAAEVRGFRWTRSGRGEAARSAISADRFDVMKLLAQNQPDPGTILEAVRRRIIGPGTASTLLRRGGWSDDAIEIFMDLRTVLLSPGQLAEAVNRGEMSRDEGARRAALAGVDGGDFDLLTTIIDFPPGVDRLQEALRRGFIDQSRFRRGIAQSTLRVEWADVMERLQFQRMSPVAATDAVNQGKMSLEEGRRIAFEGGLDADDFEILVETAGIPPGVSLMQEAWNRGIINERQFTEGFLESNIKNKWVDLLKATRFRVMPREQINLTYRFGGFDKTEAIKRYRWFGFSRADAEAMLVAEDRRKMGAERDLSLSTILELYETEAIDRATTVEFLTESGFDETSINLMLSLRDVRREQRFANLAVSRVRSQFVRFEIDDGTAQNALDRLGVRARQRDALIDTWNIEREIDRPQLTVSQIQQATRAGILPLDEGFTRLVQRGYTEPDAAILIQLAAPRG